MIQSRLESMIESLTSTAIGFVLSMIAWRILAQFLGYDISWGTNFFITGIFTLLSVVRGYVVRRFFNGRFWHVILKWLSRQTRKLAKKSRFLAG